MQHLIEEALQIPSSKRLLMSRLISLLSICTPLLIQAQQFPVRAIRERNGNLTIIPAKTTWLTIGGNYTFSAAESSATTTPSGNSLFTTGPSTGQSISLQANIKNAHWRPLWSFSLKAATNSETTIIPDNNNSSRSISASAERHLGTSSITGSYSYFSSRFSNDNSNGFLNRVYENALLTPAHNPWFPLKDNGHFEDKTQQTGQLSLKKTLRKMTFGANTTLGAIGDNSNQSLKPGTPFFPAGLLYTRQATDDHYSSNAYMTYNIDYGGSAFSSTARLNYIYNDEKVNFAYPSDRYSYRRSGSDASFTCNSRYAGNDFTAGLNAGSKFYRSTTSLHNKFFLPEISGFVSPNHLFDYHLDARLAANYNAFCSEPPIDRDFSSFLLTQLTPQEAFRFIPFTEVRSFNSLSLLQHREFTSWLRLDLDHFISLYAEFSTRNTKDNVFPVYENNQLLLKNLADTRYKGFELQLQFNTPTRTVPHVYTSNSISFYKFSDIVTRVHAGYNGHTIAGFSTVYKALVERQPVGVIMESSNPPSILGNPTPDYTLKMAHVATWSAISANIDWEYRKGGDVWNGTAAIQDHTGQSASAAMQKGDNIRIHNLSLSYDIKIKPAAQRIRLTAFAQNLLLWTAYTGADPNQLLYDQSVSGGLDFFNLPSTKNYGASASIQF